VLGIVSVKVLCPLARKTDFLPSGAFTPFFMTVWEVGAGSRSVFIN